MKFGSIVLSAALLTIGTSAFSVASSATSRSRTKAAFGAMEMAASTEIINGEAKTKKTREVRGIDRQSNVIL
jgi:hypothetical protein